MKTILLSFPEDQITKDQLTQVSKLASEARIVVTRDPSELEAIAEEIEVVAGWLSPDLLLNLSNLRWYQQLAVGVDWLMRYPEAVERDFILTNASGVHVVPMSELIFAFMLSFARGLPAAHQAKSQVEWIPTNQASLFELAGKTMVLIGVGAIGSRTARIATALGMRVIGVRRNPAVEVWDVAKMVGREELLEVLPEADFVVLTLPLTHETKHFITQQELQQMKPSAYLVNIGRGPVVHEADLVAALQAGSIAGAGLDVFETEPLPKDSPLWKMDNVIITAHYASSIPNYYGRVMSIFLDNLRRYQAGEALRNGIDKKRGY